MLANVDRIIDPHEICRIKCGDDHSIKGPVVILDPTRKLKHPASRRRVDDRLANYKLVVGRIDVSPVIVTVSRIRRRSRRAFKAAERHLSVAVNNGNLQNFVGQNAVRS